MRCTSPIKWRQRPDMSVAVDWTVKHHFNKKLISTPLFSLTSVSVSNATVCYVPHLQKKVHVVNVEAVALILKGHI